MERILVIQTAFIGDAILTTALLERLHSDYPKARIDYLVRKGNEPLFEEHPFINQVLIWDKSSVKYSELWNVLRQIRKNSYDAVYNVQRFASSGFLTAFSGANKKIGYSKNPLSFLFTSSVQHRFGKGFRAIHEVDRVVDLHDFNSGRVRPKLYPTYKHRTVSEKHQRMPYVTIAPGSVWFTKQFPVEKWVSLIDEVPTSLDIFLIGGPSDSQLAKKIIASAKREVTDLTGRLKLLETAAFMENAQMNYANDSAPVHLASAVNAPICEVYCSTVPSFGFTPLSDKSFTVESEEPLQCKPCGIHGKSSCPKRHFKCATSINTRQLLSVLD